ncbi:hypothetical protein SAMN05421659_1272 [[Clostridium] fimetarium]|uniref:Uncharacterized protein n=1 Tax=[Clostridium] fimetarium TaxID=99656 RepID=A0A1I0RW94_9FIRM|nr:hypothetical protein SAMN05421659_1272 [[Clostridium] fimetarium]
MEDFIFANDIDASYNCRTKELMELLRSKRTVGSKHEN